MEMPSCVVSVLYKEMLVTHCVALENIGVYYLPLVCPSDILKNVLRHPEAFSTFSGATVGHSCLCTKIQFNCFSELLIKTSAKNEIVASQILLAKHWLHCTNKGISNVTQMFFCIPVYTSVLEVAFLSMKD